MTLAEFTASLTQAAPPPILRPSLVALWHDGRGDWDTAHRVAQDVEDAEGAWVHAYLHRKEGDLANAGYWYRRANRPAASDQLTKEWERLVSTLLADTES
jgi:hypothetical protein